jgi:hypothetical protein
MKAIETKWKGWRFRSRTEARWAVFLDAAGIAFEYEPEGVILPSGPYLPDFRLRGFELPAGIEPQDVWLEIKGDEPTEDERRKCSELAEVSGCPVLLAVGAPDFMEQVYLFNDDISKFTSEIYAAGVTKKDDVFWRDFLSHMQGQLAFMNVGGPEQDTIVVARGPRDPADRENDAVRAGDTIGDAEEWARFNEMARLFDGIVCRVLGMRGGMLPMGKAYIGIGQKLRDAYDTARSARFEFGQTDKRWKADR